MKNLWFKWWMLRRRMMVSVAKMAGTKEGERVRGLARIIYFILFPSRFIMAKYLVPYYDPMTDCIVVRNGEKFPLHILEHITSMDKGTTFIIKKNAAGYWTARETQGKVTVTE